MAAATSRGENLRDSPSLPRLEAMSKKLGDELRWSLDNDGVEDFTTRLKSFVDEILDLWSTSIYFNENNTTSLLHIVRAEVSSKLTPEAQEHSGSVEPEDSNPSD
jgi:hypothetical protein